MFKHHEGPVQRKLYRAFCCDAVVFLLRSRIIAVRLPVGLPAIPFRDDLNVSMLRGTVL